MRHTELLRVALLISTTLLCGCSADGLAPRTVSEQGTSAKVCRGRVGFDAEAQARDVYKVAVDELFIGQPSKPGFRSRGEGPWPKPRLLLLWRQTSGWLERLREYRKDFSLVPQVVLNDFEAENSSPRPLPADLDLMVEHKFISDKEFRSLVKVKGGIPDWTAYYDKYPMPENLGVVSLSRVGFNEDYTEALIYAGMGCGRGCGHGAYLFLRREGSTWQIREYYGAWMS